MADDIEEEVADQSNDKEFGGGFADKEATPAPTEAEAAAETKAAEEAKKAEDSKNATPEAKAEAEKAAAEKKAADEAGMTDEEKAKAAEAAAAEQGEAEKKLAARAKGATPELTDEQKAQAAEAERQKAEAAKAKEAEEKAKAEAEKAKVAPVAATIEDILKDPAVAGAKMKIVNDVGEEVETTFADFAKQYPEIAQASLIVGGRIAQSTIEAAMKDGKFASAEKIAELTATIQSEMAHMEFMQGLIAGTVDKDGNFVQGHADAKRIVGSPEYKAWIAKQSPGIRALEQSADPLDAIAIIDAYKESLGKTSKKAADEKAKAEKEKLDKTHKESLRSAQKAEDGETANSPEDFDAGFSEGAAKK